MGEKVRKQANKQKEIQNGQTKNMKKEKGEKIIGREIGKKLNMGYEVQNGRVQEAKPVKKKK